MSHELNLENILIQVRDCLNSNGIKLWLEPYYIDGQPVDSELEKLARNFRTQLNIPYETTLAAITELQSHSLDKLKLIGIYKEQGIASLKVRVPGKSSGTKLITVQIKLSENAKKLQESVAEKLETSWERIKLISSGRVLNTNQTLQEQGIKNLQQILALQLEVSAKAAQEESDIYERILKIRSEAEVLLKSQQEQFFHLEDQAGNTINVPENEKKSLIMALLLHDKGKAKLKSDNFNEALIFFLEADREMNSCNSQLVQTVDNYAILNLDIVWCYLCLKSIMQLPDAERRLQICEQSFKKSYGENLSRVSELKGSAENEKTLIMRLHLLQGVLYFHQNRRTEANAMLSVAERELTCLRVDETAVSMLMEMGYTQSEAVTGLRSSYGSIDGAVNFITERRAQLKEARKKGKKERDLKKSLKDLGIEDVNLKTLGSLIDMGFQKEVAALALKKCNNDIATAISMLHQKYSELEVELSSMIKPKEDLIDRLLSLGFDKELSASILKITNNDIDAAIERILQLQSEGSSSIPDQLLNLLDQALPGTSGTGQAGSSSSTTQETAAEKLKKKLQRTLEEERAFDLLKEDIDEIEDDEYLGQNLDQEEILLKQYKRILSD